jgi:hypothetical protein
MTLSSISTPTDEIAAMDTSQNNLCTLFAQLGLACEPPDIEQFIVEHSPLDPAVHIIDASFWAPAQSSFLRQQMTADAEWAEVVDELNVRLHK